MQTKPWNFKYEVCTIEDCDKAHTAKGMCQMHYRRVKLHKDPNANATPQNNSKLAQLLNGIDSGQNQVSLARGIAGNSLKALESFSTNHAEEQIVNNSALSLLEDLDYAEAITEFEKQQLALNAVSSVFGKVGSLSLFDYI